MDREAYLSILIAILKCYIADDEIGDNKTIELIKEIEKLKKDLTNQEM